MKGRSLVILIFVVEFSKERMSQKEHSINPTPSVTNVSRNLMQNTQSNDDYGKENYAQVIK